jgi:hypothetical protein
MLVNYQLLYLFDKEELESLKSEKTVFLSPNDVFVASIFMMFYVDLTAAVFMHCQYCTCIFATEHDLVGSFFLFTISLQRSVE